MSVFVDSSAFLSILNSSDASHREAVKTWKGLLTSRKPLLTTNYVIVETFAVAQNRMGVPVVRALQEEILPVVHTEWVRPEDHQAAVAMVLAAGRRNLSLVDGASFAVMRRLGLKQCFAFDSHFLEQGFEAPF